MTVVRTPRTTAAAAKLLERFAELARLIAGVEAQRNAAIGEANRVADVALEPFVAERAAIASKLEPWWRNNSAELTGGKRKSIELAGCVVGTRRGRVALDIGDEDAAVAWLVKRDWAKPLLRVTTKLDRKAILQSLDGVYKAQLTKLGLKRKGGADEFFVEPVEQAGTIAGDKASG